MKKINASNFFKIEGKKVYAISVRAFSRRDLSQEFLSVTLTANS